MERLKTFIIIIIICEYIKAYLHSPPSINCLFSQFKSLAFEGGVNKVKWTHKHTGTYTYTQGKVKAILL